VSGRVTVSEVEASDNDAWATVAFGSEEHRVGVWDLPAPPPVPADVFVLPAALIGSYRHEAVHIDGAVSRPLLDTLPAALGRYARWFPQLAVTDLTVESTTPNPPSRSGRSATMFSGGLDSFHTAVTHSELDALVFVRGLDIGLDDTPVMDLAVEHIRAAASALGRPLIEISTDMKRLMYAVNQEWGWFYYGPLAGAAFALGGELGLVLQSASVPDVLLTGEFAPLLETADLSTGYTDFVRTGQEVTRPDKAREVCDNDAVRRHLRVCWQNLGDQLNCGVCEKCIRTAVGFELAGCLCRIETLPDTVDLAAVATLPVATRSDRWFVEENLLVAQRENRAGIESALRAALAQGCSDGTLELP